MLKYVLFDLDGTITDPMQSITTSAAYALEKLGITVTDLSELECFIGPPLTVSFQQYYGMDAERALDGLRLYREHYAVHGLEGNIPYEGAAEMLSTLKQAGKTLLLATSKPVEYAEEILKRTQLRAYFDFVGGNDLNESRPTKEQVIAYLMEHYPDLNGKNAIMVGDRKYDIAGAHHFGLPCVAVCYGYGNREEFAEHGAEYVVQDVAELTRLLTQYDVIRCGRYRHFKGNEYRVIALARHSETGEEMVVYQALYGERGYWVRPAKMWNEMIEHEGECVRRFTYLGE